tara:strand:+ start:218 stop:379 length:162 start_codon:yes stop_codon:yes gene_type:complete
MAPRKRVQYLFLVVILLLFSCTNRKEESKTTKNQVVYKIDKEKIKIKWAGVMW